MFRVNSKGVIDINLLSLLLTLNMFQTFFYVSIVDFEKVIVCQTRTKIFFKLLCHTSEDEVKASFHFYKNQLIDWFLYETLTVTAFLGSVFGIPSKSAQMNGLIIIFVFQSLGSDSERFFHITLPIIEYSTSLHQVCFSRQSETNCSK